MKKNSYRFEDIFDADRKRSQVFELEKKASQPEFWNNQDEAQKVLQKRSRLERDIELDAKLAREGQDIRRWPNLRRKARMC